MLTARRHIEAIAALTLALQLALSLPMSAGLVLCVGSDGHVAVESGGAAGCGPLTKLVKVGCDELGYPAPCSDTTLDDGVLVSGSCPRASDCDAPLVLAPAFTLSPTHFAAASPHALAATLGNTSRAPLNVILRL